MAERGDVIDEKERDDPEKLDMKIDGFDVELQGLPSITYSMAMIDLKITGLDPEIANLVKLSRRYLKLTLIKAIERHGGKTQDAELSTIE